MDGSRNPDSDAIVNDASIGSIIGPAVIDTDMAEQFAADLGITMEQLAGHRADYCGPRRRVLGESAVL